MFCRARCHCIREYSWVERDVRATRRAFPYPRPKHGTIMRSLISRLETNHSPVRPARPGSGCQPAVESFLRGIEVVHDDESLGASFIERHRGDSPTLASFVIRPDEAGLRRHCDVPAEERHRLLGGRMAEHKTVGASRKNIGVARNERYLKRRPQTSCVLTTSSRSDFRFYFCSDPRIPLVPPVFPITAFAARNGRETVRQLDAFDVLGLFVSKLAFNAQPQRSAVLHVQRMSVQRI